MVVLLECIVGLNNCDWLWENRSKSHIWYFKNYQFEIFNPL